MKKISLFITGLLFVLALGFSACAGCNKTQEPVVAEDTIVTEAVLNVEHVIATDRQDMFLNYSENYRWFETCIQLENYLDDEECDGTVHSVSNVFQAIEDTENGADVFVVLYAHLADTSTVDVRHGFWVEDFPMEEDAIKLTYQDAFERIMETNSPKPHSKNCVLRKPMGPLPCNAQYVFGNVQAQLWVDAETGEVRNSNPAFSDEEGFKMPLGEWP